MIVDPVLDVRCLSRLTAIARHEIRNPLVAEYVERIRALARRRGISVKDATILWLQELPQTDDDGSESVRAIACSPDQRTRLFPDDPNCFERALAALILLESIDPTWQYTLASIDDPLRHTGLLQRPGAAYEWEPVDLFPSAGGAAGGFFAWLRGAAGPGAKRKGRRARGGRETGLYTRMRGDGRDAKAGYLVQRVATEPPMYYRVLVDNGGRYVQLVRVHPDGSTEGEPFTDDVLRYERVRRMRRAARAPRNFGWDDFTHYAQPVMQYVHPVGKAVLGYFGAGAVGDYAEKYEKQYGLLKDDKKPEQKPAPSTPAPKAAPAASTPAASSPQRPAAQPARPVQTFLPVRRPISAPPTAQPPPAPPAPAPPSASLIDPYSTQGGPNADDEPETYAFFWPPRRAASAREAAQAPQRRLW